MVLEQRNHPLYVVSSSCHYPDQKDPAFLSVPKELLSFSHAG
jgi:hypothetical protein